MRVELPQGVLRGEQQDGIASFKGIPYAAAPFDERRFAEPGPPPSWDGERDATAYGPTAPKPPYPVPFDTLLPEPQIPGEECLNLNVWTPDPSAAGLPVLVWVHGGAFVNGTGAVPTYDATAFARDGVVGVTINYRLGVDGFALIEGTAVNRGMLDQVAALQWVRDNIASFGGDPDNVTVAGESAGAFSVATLLAMPKARGLFRRAIMQSGAGQHALTPDTAAMVTAALAKRLDVPTTADGFASVPVDRLVAAQAALSAEIAAQPLPQVWGEIATNAMAFEPVIDGEVLPALPIEEVRRGASRDVEVLIGTTAEENALFLVPNGMVNLISDELLSYSCALLGTDLDTVRSAYGKDEPAGQVMIAVMTDWFFRVPAIRLAEARLALGADTYVYELGWRSPLFDGRLGACHALEIPFVFDKLTDPTSAWLTGFEAPQQLADEMHRAWVDFVRDGAPGWEPYGEQRRVKRFDAPSEVASDPRAEQRAMWDGIR